MPSRPPARPLRTRLAAGLMAALVALPSLAPAQVNLPALGDAISDDLALGNERRLGEQIMRDIRRDPAYLEEPVLDEYLRSLWDPLIEAARRRGDIPPEAFERLAWQTFLVRDRSVNAFALPGGYVGVHLGLISLTATRDELASVMAHELSHVTQRHIARSISNSQRQSLIGLAALILGVLAASRSNASGDAVGAVVAGGQAAAIQGQLNFSRDMEREADRVGFALMTQAGFAPGGMAAMFEKLDGAFRLNDGNNFPYLRTHPLTTERIGEARARLGAAPSAPPPASPLEHAVMQGRARALMDPRIEALQRLQTLDQADAGTQGSLPPSVAERLTALVASALASSQLRDRERAAAAAEAALGLVRGSPRSDARAERAVLLMQAQLAMERGDAAQAAAVLGRFADDRSRPLAMLRAGLATQRVPADAQRLRDSAEELQTLVALQPLDAPAWGQLAQVNERLGRPLRSLRAQAESHYARGDLTGAVDRLRAGQRLAREAGNTDFIEASVIEARLRDIQAQRRQLAIELYGADRNGEPREPPQ